MANHKKKGGTALDGIRIKKYVMVERGGERRWVLVKNMTIPYGCRLWLKLLFGSDVKYRFRNGRWYRYVIQR